MEKLEQAEIPAERYLTQVGAGIVFMLVGLGALALLVNDTMKIIEAKKNLMVTEGELLHARVTKQRNKSTNRIEKAYHLHYTFDTQDGHPITGYATVPRHRYVKVTKNGELEVEYDALVPSNNYINGIHQTRTGNALGGIFALLMFGVGFVMWLKRPPWPTTSNT